MLYLILAETYEMLEAHPSRLEKIDILAHLIKTSSETLLPDLLLLARGQIFAAWTMKEIDFGINHLMESIRKATGTGSKDIVQKIKELGDIGKAAQWAVEHRKQTFLHVEPLLVEDVVGNLRKLSGISGSGTVAKKVDLVAQLFSKASGIEARYIARTITSELRVGVGEGVVRDAVGKVFDVPSAELDRAYALTNDFGIIAKMLKEEGSGALRSLKLEIGRPVKVMLAQKAVTLEDGMLSMAFDALPEKKKRAGSKPSDAGVKYPLVAFEYKYDGFRVQIHKKGDGVKLFTRRLEDVTAQFPDIVDVVKRSVTAKDVICEAEAIGVDSETGEWLPFQKISKRIKRKYDIEDMAKQIPVVTHVFDILYLDGRSVLDLPFKERRKLIERIVAPSKRLVLAQQLITDDPGRAREFYEYSLSLGNEGVMLKNLETSYQAGSRVGHMLKLKPIMDTLDLVIIGAEWGVGRRAGWFGSYILGAYDSDSGTFPEVGRMATGMSDEQFKEMTEVLKPLVLEEIGKVVAIKPRVVVEVGYEEIQRSPTYTSGFALRFPRLIRFRDDKAVDEADTLSRIGELFSQQAQRDQ